MGLVSISSCGRKLSMLGCQGLEEGEPGGRRQREMGTKRQVIETRMRWAGREVKRKDGKQSERLVSQLF